MTNYFNGCTNPDDVKRLYREMAKIFHPDAGGNAHDMAELTRQYEQALKGNQSYSYGTSEELNAFNEKFRAAFEKEQDKYYGGFGGYRYSNQGNMWSKFKEQQNDPRLAEYERMKVENIDLNSRLAKFSDRYYELKMENEALKKKLERLKKKLSQRKKKSKSVIML
jgi:hypothetical protein